ncbi:hypothetical protein BTN50_0885 [Candidatus Enterovibrio altilux]|uniref:Mobile element protein n=1 Tax=Candidatus Enterovibrio altilux TaxID=1927128 RepID=A0A291B8S8_9GAMM|nr:hypothetical protein BTN50_0885 [Candidatus Enterovibrio luxaltus]
MGNSEQILAAELSAPNVTGGEVLHNLLKLTRKKINDILTDGAYDIR